MKRFLLGGLALASLVLASSVYAFEIVEPDSAGNSRIEAGQGIEDTVFTAGQTVDIRGPISDDLFAAGSAVTVDAAVGRNVVAAGSTVAINSSVGGDVIVAGGTVTIGKDAVITGDVLVFGGTAELIGTVNGKVQAYAGTLTIDGTVAGNVTAQADEVLLGNAAKVGGSLTGYVSTALDETIDAKVDGTLDVSLLNGGESAEGLMSDVAFEVLGTILMLLGMLILGLILILLLPNAVSRLRTSQQKNPAQSALVGLLVLVGTPVLFALSLVFLVTIPFGLLVLALFGVLALCAGVTGNIWVGDLIGKGAWSPLKSLAIGAVIVTLVSLIPFVGGLAAFIVWMVGLGSTGLVAWTLVTTKAGK